MYSSRSDCALPGVCEYASGAKIGSPETVPFVLADHASGAAGEGDRVMAQQLKSPQREQRHEIAHVQAVGGGIETAVERGGHSEALGQLRGVRAIGHEAAPVEFVQNAHGRKVNS